MWSDDEGEKKTGSLGTYLREASIITAMADIVVEDV
jgi:hypothetical protein